MRSALQSPRSIATAFAAAMLVGCLHQNYVPPSTLPPETNALTVRSTESGDLLIGETVVRDISRGSTFTVDASANVNVGARAGVGLFHSSQRLRFEVVHRDQATRGNCTRYFDSSESFQRLECDLEDSEGGQLLVTYGADGSGETIGGEPLRLSPGRGHGIDISLGYEAVGGVDLSQQPTRVLVAPVETAIERTIMLATACLVVHHGF